MDRYYSRWYLVDCSWFGIKASQYNFYHLPTNCRLNKFNLSVDNFCESCPNIKESNDHIVWCNSASFITAKQKWEEDIFNYLSKRHTQTEVRDLLYYAFHHWIYNEDMVQLNQHHLTTVSSELKAAFLAQSKIGWNHFFRGRLSSKWKLVILRHLKCETHKS